MAANGKIKEFWSVTSCTRTCLVFPWQNRWHSLYCEPKNNHSNRQLLTGALTGSYVSLAIMAECNNCSNTSSCRVLGLLYEIFHKPNLYDLCFEILLTTRLAKILVGKLSWRHNAFQTKMWYSNLGKFRRVLVSVAEKVCVSEGFG